MNDTLKIRTLTERFFDGETTLAEEQQLYDYYRQEPESLPADLRSLRQMFLDMAAVQSVAVLQQQTEQPPSRSWRHWAVAAVATVLLAGGAMLLFYRYAQVATDDEEMVAYIYGQRTTDRNIVLGEMQKTMTAMAEDDSNIVEEQLKAMFGNE